MARRRRAKSSSNGHNPRLPGISGGPRRKEANRRRRERECQEEERNWRVYQRSLEKSRKRAERRRRDQIQEIVDTGRYYALTVPKTDEFPKCGGARGILDSFPPKVQRKLAVLIADQEVEFRKVTPPSERELAS